MAEELNLKRVSSVVECYILMDQLYDSHSIKLFPPESHQSCRHKIQTYLTGKCDEHF